MNTKIRIIDGGRYTDEQGTLDYVNDFDMSLVKRMYMISLTDTTTVKGWRGHRIEQRWFYVVKGSFEFSLIQIDNFESPSNDLEIVTYTVSAETPHVIYVPVGYASAIRALEIDAKVMVYADSNIEDASKDDHQYPIDYFVKFRTSIIQ